MVETLRETLGQMGFEPSDTDPLTGEPAYCVRDIPRAIGVPETDLETAMAHAEPGGPSNL